MKTVEEVPIGNVFIGSKDGEKPAAISRIIPKEFIRLGKQISISPKSMATVNEPEATIVIFEESVRVSIGIGNDHTADLIMRKSAWEALMRGEEVHTTPVKEFISSITPKRNAKSNS